MRPATVFSHRGRVRSSNEDATHVNDAAGLYVVCDGMGGHAAGEVASQLAVSVVGAALAGLPPLRALAGQSREPVISARAQALHEAVCAANAAVWHKAQVDRACEGMGTTVVAALLVPGGVVVAHAGDSRVYLQRRVGNARADGSARTDEDVNLYLLTSDHTVGDELLAGGHTDAYAQMDPSYRAGITRALGLEERVDVVVQVYDTSPGDVLLLCSDGLYSEVLPEELGPALADDYVCETLLSLALRRGRDNVTGVVVRIE